MYSNPRKYPHLIQEKILFNRIHYGTEIFIQLEMDIRLFGYNPNFPKFGEALNLVSSNKVFISYECTIVHHRPMHNITRMNNF